MTEINYEQLIGQWHKDRNLIDGSTDKDQYMKLIQEAGELSDSLCKGKDIKDDIGDMKISDEDIIKLNIPTGIPLVYELDIKLNPLKHYYLGDSNELEKRLARVEAQGKSN